MAKKGKGKGDEVLDALRKASKGLVFMSETDSDLEPFVWEGGPDKLTRKDVLKLAGEDADAEVEEQSLDDFFHTVPPEDKAQFDKLAAVLKEQLSGIKVYKVGDEAMREKSGNRRRAQYTAVALIQEGAGVAGGMLMFCRWEREVCQ